MFCHVGWPKNSKYKTGGSACNLLVDRNTKENIGPQLQHTHFTEHHT